MQEDKHYLYRHIRLDKNEVFYVGIGTKNKKDIENYTYSRAKSKGSRTDFWRNIVNKADYEIEIILESDDYQFIKQKEIEFVKLYGRTNLGLGTLVNLTDGGDGTLGFLPTEEYRRNLSIARKNRIKAGYRGSCLKETFQYCGETGKLMKIWPCILDAANSINVRKSSLSKTCKGINNNYSKGYFWFTEDMGPIVKRDKGMVRNYGQKIIMIDKDTNAELFEFDSIGLAYKYLQKEHNGLIRRAIKNNSVAYNYKWKIKDE